MDMQVDSPSKGGEASFESEESSKSYHFFGLAETQTQGQSELEMEGSQKENIQAVPRVIKGKPSPRKPLSKAADSQSRSRYKRSVATRKRSLSQDSFATYDDPQEEFLAKNKTKLDVPLSELDRLSEEEDEDSMQRSGRPGSISRGTGKILAEDSSQSQSQSQSQRHPQTDDDSLADVYNGLHSKDTKDVDMDATQNSESAYASSAPSSDYARFGEPPEESEPAAPTATTLATTNTMLPTVDHDLIVPDDYVLPDNLEETQQSFIPPIAVARPTTKRALSPTTIPSSPPMPIRARPAAPRSVRNEQVPIPPAQSNTAKKPPTKRRRNEEVEIVPDSMVVETEEQEQEEEKKPPLKGLKSEKGKGKPASIAPKAPPKLEMKQTVSEKAKEEASTSKPSRAVAKKKDDVQTVPSSVPGEKTVSARSVRSKAKPTAAVAKPKAKTKGKGKGAPARSKRGTAKKVSEETSDEEEHLEPESEDGPNGAEDEDQQPSAAKPVETAPVAPPADRKRKRSTKVEEVNSTYKRQRRNNTMTTTSLSLNDLVDRRVWGYWSSTSMYYTGTVVGRKGDKLEVIFDDSAKGTLSLEDLRQYGLRKDDEVWHQKRKYTVDIMNSDDEVLISANGRQSTAHIADLSVKVEYVLNNWEDRMIQLPDGNVAQPKSPSRGRSVVSTRSTVVPADRLFSGYGILVTLTDAKTPVKEDNASIKQEDSDDEESGDDAENVDTGENVDTTRDKKNAVVQSISENGGSVIDDFDELINLKGSLSADQWLLTASKAEWIGKPGVVKLFLIADQCSQTSKYLTAIALGVPCLSIKWVEDSIQAGVVQPWISYLLPQGYSRYLKAKVSQFVDLGWDAESHSLDDVMNSRVASKLFRDKQILCVGPDVVLAKRKNTTVSAQQKAKKGLPTIMLAMGATSVVAAHTLKPGDWTDYDFVVFQDKSQYVKAPHRSNTNSVIWESVKDALVSGRALWDLERRCN